MRASASLLQHVDTLVLTLERGWAGKGKYLALLKHLGLTKSKKVVEVPNTFEYRATAKKVCNRGLPCVLPEDSDGHWNSHSWAMQGDQPADRTSPANRDTRTA